MAQRFFRNQDGAAAIEFSFTSPVYFLMLLGLFQLGVWLWCDFALQRGVEAASRCASIDTTTCGTTSAIQSYAASATTGLAIPASSFTVNKTTCGYQVSATYSVATFTAGFGLPGVSVSASACYPI